MNFSEVISHQKEIEKIAQLIAEKRESRKGMSSDQVFDSVRATVEKMALVEEVSEDGANAYLELLSTIKRLTELAESGKSNMDTVLALLTNTKVRNTVIAVATVVGSVMVMRALRRR